MFQDDSVIKGACDDLIKASQCLIKPIQRLESEAAIAGAQNILGLLCHGSINKPDSLDIITTLTVDDTQQVQAVEITRVSFQHFAIDTFGLRQSTGSMERKGLPHQWNPSCR